MSKKVIKKTKMKISYNELVINSANKNGRHTNKIFTGTHVDKSKYNRKNKENQRLKYQSKGYEDADFLFNLSYVL